MTHKVKDNRILLTSLNYLVQHMLKLHRMMEAKSSGIAVSWEVDVMMVAGFWPVSLQKLCSLGPGEQD
jgi:hypothetical protein